RRWGGRLRHGSFFDDDRLGHGNRFFHDRLLFDDDSLDDRRCRGRRSRARNGKDAEQRNGYTEQQLVFHLSSSRKLGVETWAEYNTRDFTASTTRARSVRHDLG